VHLRGRPRISGDSLGPRTLVRRPATCRQLRSTRGGSLQLGQYLVRLDQLAGVGLRNAAFERALERSAFFGAHVLRRRVVQVDAKLDAIWQIDGFVHDDPTVDDVSLEGSHQVRIHDRSYD
jgi:hypothetical protein